MDYKKNCSPSMLFGGAHDTTFWLHQITFSVSIFLHSHKQYFLLYVSRVKKASSKMARALITSPVEKLQFYFIFIYVSLCSFSFGFAAIVNVTFGAL